MDKSQVDLNGQPWCLVWDLSLNEFVLSMLETFGRPIETLLVGAFYDEGRAAQRDIDVDLHHDGVYSEAVAKTQGGTYIEAKDVRVVGFYCLVENTTCTTLVQEVKSGEIHHTVLRANEALILDNRRVKHARIGPVGNRVLFRMWMDGTRPGM